MKQMGKGNETCSVLAMLILIICTCLFFYMAISKTYTTKRAQKALAGGDWSQCGNDMCKFIESQPLTMLWVNSITFSVLTVLCGFGFWGKSCGC